MSSMSINKEVDFTEPVKGKKSKYSINSKSIAFLVSAVVFLQIADAALNRLVSGGKPQDNSPFHSDVIVFCGIVFAILKIVYPNPNKKTRPPEDTSNVLGATEQQDCMTQYAASTVFDRSKRRSDVASNLWNQAIGLSNLGKKKTVHLRSDAPLFFPPEMLSKEQQLMHSELQSLGGNDPGEVVFRSRHWLNEISPVKFIKNSLRVSSVEPPQAKRADGKVRLQKVQKTESKVEPPQAKLAGGKVWVPKAQTTESKEEPQAKPPQANRAAGKVWLPKKKTTEELVAAIVGVWTCEDKSRSGQLQQHEIKQMGDKLTCYSQFGSAIDGELSKKFDLTVSKDTGEIIWGRSNRIKLDASKINSGTIKWVQPGKHWEWNRA